MVFFMEKDELSHGHWLFFLTKKLVKVLRYNPFISFVLFGKSFPIIPMTQGIKEEKFV